jgi:hypothetical protein
MGKYLQYLNESESRYCHIYKANNNKWYTDLASGDGNHQQHTASTYGPFNDIESAEKYISDEFSNPGGWSIDKSGKKQVPKESPNGRPVTKPLSENVDGDKLRANTPAVNDLIRV